VLFFFFFLCAVGGLVFGFFFGIERLNVKRKSTLHTNDYCGLALVLWSNGRYGLVPLCLCSLSGSCFLTFL